jgi:hypothetical protein
MPDWRTPDRVARVKRDRRRDCGNGSEHRPKTSSTATACCHAAWMGSKPLVSTLDRRFYVMEIAISGIACFNR